MAALATAGGSPQASPAITGLAAEKTTARTISDRVAPSASRIPISFIRRLTMNEITP
jgi:hypothetical protein